MKPDHDVIKAFLREAADTFVLPRFKKLDTHEIHEKQSATDLVTLADIEAEEFLKKALRNRYPSIAFMGEETVYKDSSVLSLLQQTEQDYFVIDPVDGTANFVAGKPEFGLMLSFVADGEVRQAYIYDTLQDHFMTAAKGEGAYDGDKRIVFSEDSARLKIGFSKPKYHSETVRAQFNAAAADIDWHILGCSAHEYLRLLRAQERFYFACNVKPWDHLAGSLIVREAGGSVRQWDGRDYTPKDLNASILSASSPEEWNFLHRKFLQPAVQLTHKR